MSVAKVADVVVFTSRCSTETGDLDSVSRLDGGAVANKVVDWLERNGFPFADVYVGQGKPRVAAFIDDVAIQLLAAV